MAEQVDVIVVGMGPGGETAAEELAHAGLSVIGIDSHLVGGECAYYGCIPTKMMIRAANVLAEARRVPALAGTAETTPDFAPVAHRIRTEATDDWNDQVAVDRFQNAGGRFVRGHATITGTDTVQVVDTTYQARKAIILNTGTSPAVPPIPGLADTPFWTNRDAVAATTAPESLIVLGGGAVGVELGQAFARFGSTIDIVEAADRLLPAEEPESSSLIQDVLTAEGIRVHTGSPADSVSHDGARFTVTVDGTTLTAERLLVGTGRRPNITDLGLDSIGVDATGRSLTTDDHGRLTDTVFAIGDITGRGAFTHVSVYQARIVVDTILGRDHGAGEYHAVPRVTFTDPEIAAVGLTEAEARRADLQITTALTQIPNSTRGWLHAIGNQGFIKLIVDSRRGILVGATSASPVGGEVLSLLTLAVHERTPIEHLRDTIYAYPTFHRALDDALAQL
ncbi:dihydrolipoyl dehydrogenase family protein [Leifsonia sp. L25]|uniref:dihydrolipoyl dehydrogenase family protein n=1 Tax=Actinomycetes TaxID=1760 RepID=UPI003D682D9D